MVTMLALTRRFRASSRARGDDGVSTVEYGLLVAAIAAVVILALFAVATLVEQGFQSSCEAGAGGADTTASCSS